MFRSGGWVEKKSHSEKNVIEVVSVEVEHMKTAVAGVR